MSAMHQRSAYRRLDGEAAGSRRPEDGAMTPRRQSSVRLLYLRRRVCRFAGVLYLAMITSSIALVLTLTLIQ
jgi:hypothetical protein